MPDLPLQLPNVPEGFCNSLNDANWIQTLLNLIAQGVAKFEGSGFTVVLSQATAPGPEDRDKLWYDTDVGRIYRWSGGAWISPHPYGASGIAGLWVEATPAQIWAFDGGDGTDPAINPPSANNGAMWVINTNYIGRSPMGAGVIPNANPAKTLAVGENYGEGAHTMTAQEVAAHTHPLATEGSITNVDGSIDVVNTGVGGAGLQIGLTGPATTPLTVQANEFITTHQSMPVIHPVRGQYYIVRSARVNYVGA